MPLQPIVQLVIFCILECMSSWGDSIGHAAFSFFCVADLSMFFFALYFAVTPEL
jgi:hypothetical protein